MNYREIGIEQYIISHGIRLSNNNRPLITSNLHRLTTVQIPGLIVLRNDPAIIDCWHFLFPRLSLDEIHEVLDHNTVVTNNPKIGDIAVYFKKEIMHPWQRTHGAKLTGPGIFTSKWGEKYPYICQHTIDLVPVDYGSIAIYLSLSSDLKQHLV